MGRVYKHKSGYFYHQFRGTRKSLKTKDKEIARVAARSIELRAADPTYAAAHETTITTALRSFLDRQRQRDKAEGTMSMHELHAGHIARVLGPATLLAEIDSVKIDAYFKQRDDEGAAKSTQGKELSTLRGTLRLASRSGLFHRSLESVLPHGFEVKYVPRQTHLTLPEVKKLLAKLEPERAAVCAFIVATAADWKSVHAAKKGDLNLKANLVLVRGSKNARRWRTIPILKPFRQFAVQAAGFIPFEPWGNVRRDLEVACRRAKVTKITPRDLRRSHASILRGMGVEPQLLAKMLGHVDSRMVERVYGQLPVDALAALLTARLGAPGTESLPVPKRRRKTAKRRSAA